MAVLLSAFLSCQPKISGDFLAQFDSAPFANRHIYASDDFKNKEIFCIPVWLIGNIGPVDNQILFEHIYASHTFEIDKNNTAFILIFDNGGTHKTSVLYVYNKIYRSLVCEPVIVAESYGYEGSFGNLESWFFDNNNDSYLDILIKSHQYSLISSIDKNGHEQINELHSRSIVLMQWENDQYVKINVDNDMNLFDSYSFHNEVF